MGNKKDWKRMTYKEKSQLLEDLCREESAIVSLKHDSEFAFDHYDSDLKVLYVRELEISGNPTTFEMLKDLQSDIQKINSRLLVGILSEGEEVLGPVEKY